MRNTLSFSPQMVRNRPIGVNRTNENQHYLSRVLLRRFKTKGRPLYRYSIAKKDWKERSIENACSANAYNQWVQNGVLDNSFEACLSQVESLLPKTFRTLEKASGREETLLGESEYQNLCRYCTMLKLSSPAAKAGAVTSLIMQLNWEVQNKQRSLLRYFNVPEATAAAWKEEHDHGYRFVLECENLTQFAFRVHYDRTCDVTFAEFLRCKWVLSVSPTDLPISDLGLVPVHYADARATYYILPISPRLALEAVHFFDHERNSREPMVRTKTLSGEEAGEVFQTICLSAVEYIVASQPDKRVEEALKGQDALTKFCRVPNVQKDLNAGARTSDGSFRICRVTKDEYVSFIHSSITPAPSRVSAQSLQ